MSVSRKENHAIPLISSLAMLMAAVRSVHAASSPSYPRQTWTIYRPRHPPDEQWMCASRSSCSVDLHYSIFSVRGGDCLNGDGKDKHGDISHDECEYEYEYYEVEGDDEAEWDDEGAATSAATDADDFYDDAESQHHRGDYEEEPEVRVEEKVEEEIVGSDDDDDDNDDENDYLLTTPIFNEKKRNISPPQKYQLNDRVESSIPRQAEDDDDEEVYLFETPISTKKATSQTQSTRKANVASNATTTSQWWWRNRNLITDKLRPRWRPTTTTKGRQLSGRRRHVSSSRGASFISPPFYTGSSSSRSFDIRAFHGRSFYSDVLASLSSALGFLLHPVGNAIQSITNFVASTLSRYISMSLLLIRNALDFMWYGPVEGVTTTGIPTRDGGLSSFVISGPGLLIAISIVFVGLISLAITKRVPNGESVFGDLTRENKLRRIDRNNGDMEDDLTPSIEEELHFLNREFDAANPNTKDRITKSIIAATNRLWPNNRRAQQHQRRRLPNKRENRPKSRRGQRQFTIQSIQQWWKERPTQPPISIIEPQHLRHQQRDEQPPPPSLLGKEIHQLQQKLAVSEQERAILQQDVQHLLTKLRKAQELAKSASLHNKWNEKLTSRTDQSRGRIAGGVGKGAGSEYQWGVVERSSGSGIGGRNDLDIQAAGPNPRKLDGVTIVRETDDLEMEEEDGMDDYYYNDDDNDGGGDMKWPAL